jgi:hypothetical protein
VIYTVVFTPQKSLALERRWREVRWRELATAGGAAALVCSAVAAVAMFARLLGKKFPAA